MGSVLAFDVKVNRDAKVYAEKLELRFSLQILFIICRCVVISWSSFVSPCFFMSSLLSTFLSLSPGHVCGYTESAQEANNNDVAVFPVALGIVNASVRRIPSYLVLKSSMEF